MLGAALAMTSVLAGCAGNTGSYHTPPNGTTASLGTYCDKSHPGFTRQDVEATVVVRAQNARHVKGEPLAVFGIAGQFCTDGFKGYVDVVTKPGVPAGSGLLISGDTASLGKAIVNVSDIPAAPNRPPVELIVKTGHDNPPDDFEGLLDVFLSAHGTQMRGTLDDDSHKALNNPKATGGDIDDPGRYVRKPPKGQLYRDDQMRGFARQAAVAKAKELRF
jgi:hypothetical protein